MSLLVIIYFLVDVFSCIFFHSQSMISLLYFCDASRSVSCKSKHYILSYNIIIILCATEMSQLRVDSYTALSLESCEPISTPP